MTLYRTLTTCAGAALFVSALLSAQDFAIQSPAAPKFKFDADWPKPFTNKWKLGGITGLAIDKDDNIWLLNRVADLRGFELRAELTPPTGACCIAPPAMIHLDKAGNVMGSFAAQDGHGMAVDREGFVYIGQETVRKYDPKTGKVVAEVPHIKELPPGSAKPGDGTAAPHTPGKGSLAPVGTIVPVTQAPRPDPVATAAYRAKVPPTTPMIVGGIEEVRLDEPAHELYAADNYLGGRVMIFDLDTLQFKRGWGAYGKPLSQMTTDDADRAYEPGGPLPKEFRGHLTLNISNDGLVYAADRMSNRIQVTTKEGKFIKEFTVAAETRENGSTGGIAFSADKAQRYLYISDITNSCVWILNRQDGKVLGHFGTMSQNGGQFMGLHMIATDSKGNIYTGEVWNGERVQRFVPVK
jgi:sugar lactone lactonase YvrE